MSPQYMVPHIATHLIATSTMSSQSLSRLCHEALRVRCHVRGGARHHTAAELAGLDATWCPFVAWGDHGVVDEDVFIDIDFI